MSWFGRDLREHLVDCGEQRRETRQGIASLRQEMRDSLESVGARIETCANALREDINRRHAENQADIADLTQKINQLPWKFLGWLGAATALLLAVLLREHF
jgi:uncharacterized coiled-coil DUF342 family protein